MTGPQVKMGKSIQSRLVMLLLLIFIPVLAIQAYLYYESYQAQKASAFQANIEVARAVSNAFGSFIQNILNQELSIGLAITSSQPMSSKDIDRLLKSSRGNPAVRDFTWINPVGDAIHSSNDDMIGRNYSDRSYFREVANGSEWKVGELIFAKTTGEEVFGISRGIRDDKGALLGIVFAAIVPEKLDTILAFERSKDAGVSLIDSKGIHVFRWPKTEYTWEQRNWLRHYPIVAEVLEGKEATSIVTSESTGIKRIVGFTPVSVIGWVVTASRAEADVVAPIRSAMIPQGIYFLITLSLALFASLALSRPIVNSIRRLRDHALALGRGPMDMVEIASGTSELQGLSAAFNKMTEDLKLRETALRESEERLRFALETCHIGAWDLDMVDHTAYRSLEHDRIFGYEELLPQWTLEMFLQHVLPEYRAEAEAMLREATVTPTAWTHECRIRRADGEMRWIWFSGRHSTDISGHNRVAGVVQDITERKLAEVALQESERRYSDMLRRVELVSVTLDRDAKVTFCNDYLLRLTGWRREEVLGSNWFERFIPPENDELKGTLEELLNDLPSAWHHENEILTRSGERRLIRWNNSVLHSNSGEVIGTASIGEDITDRKRAEQELADTNQRLRALMEAVPVGVSFSNDATCQSISGNPAVLAQFEVANVDNLSASARDAAAPGRQVRFFRDGREITDAELPLQRAVRENAVIPPMELEVRLPGGRRWFTEASGAPVHDAQGHVIGGLAVTVDITERKRAEDTLRHANLYLEQRVQERTAELQERAHQLGRLSSQLTMAEQRERKRLAKILHDGLQQYLVAAKIQVGGLIEQAPDAALKQAAAEVEDILNESVKVSRSLAAELSPPILHEAGLLAGLEWLSRWKCEKHGLKVQLSIQMDAPVLTEDVKVLLFESIRELLLNVVKHAKTDSARVSLFQQDERSLQIIVSDNGVGFDPASESVNDGNFGLFSIRERLNLIGGRLEVDSSPGKGARFTLTAPLFIDKPLESMPCTQPDEIDHIGVDPMIRSDGKIRILLTDDHAIMREGLARLLGQETDFEVVGQASDGQEAVESAGKLLPDVILMDISMPRMDGLDATRVIHQRHPDIRIIGLSLYQEEERAKEMLDAGAVFYLAKSGPPADLRAAIRNCMKEKSQAGKENAGSPPLKI